MIFDYFHRTKSETYKKTINTESKVYAVSGGGVAVKLDKPEALLEMKIHPRDEGVYRVMVIDDSNEVIFTKMYRRSMNYKTEKKVSIVSIRQIPVIETEEPEPKNKKRKRERYKK